MASDNTISDLLPGANTTEPDNIVAELVLRTVITEPHHEVSELVPRTNISNSGNTCPFFGRLPRELRTKIYDQLYQDAEVTVDGLHYKIRTSLPKARPISHQLKVEYDERENDKCRVGTAGLSVHQRVLWRRTFD